MNPADSAPLPPAPPRFTASAAACAERGNQRIFRGAACASSVSVAEAEAQAHQLAQQRAEAAADGRISRHLLDRYPYPERTVVEPVKQRVAAATDPAQEIARLTVNAYGATVLNAYAVMFVDVDTTEDTSNTIDEVIVEKRRATEALGRVCATRADLRFRVYATKAGLRYLCTSRLFDPVAAETQELMELLLSDKRYRVLCRVQKCFRARLTPKPWRCQLPPPPAPKGFLGGLKAMLAPRADSAWVDAADHFAACRFLEEVGRAAAVDPTAQQIVALHDALSGALADKPLA